MAELELESGGNDQELKRTKTALEQKEEEAGQLLVQVEQMGKEMLAKDEENQEMRAELARLRAQVAEPAEGVPDV